MGRLLRAAALAAGAWLFASCAAPPVVTPAVAPAAGAREIPLRNAGFETDFLPGASCPPSWGCSAHVDSGAYRFTLDEAGSAAGRRSLRMERVRPEPWGIITQVLQDPALAGKRLRYTLSVRTEGATGNGAGAFVLAQGGNGSTVGHHQKLEKGTAAWTVQVLEFTVPPGTALLEVGAILEGPGTVWIDGARLEIVEP